MSINILLTSGAINFLKNSLEAEDFVKNNFCVYLSVIYPHTKYAHVNVTFCNKNEISEDDIKLDTEEFDIYVEGKSLSLLDRSIVDFINNSLVINAPGLLNSKDLSFLDVKHNIKHLFENEINVILSQHGGFIEFVDLVADVLMIKFHGGCQGCGMVGYTLNNYIEKMIKKNFPQIKVVKDVTSHDVKDYAYY